MEATYSDFMKLDIRTGRILEVLDFPEARKPAYKLVIDFGARIGTRQSSAQITDRYRKEDLPGKIVVAVVNFPPKQIGRFISEVLVLGAIDTDNNVILLSVDKPCELGLPIA